MKNRKLPKQNPQNSLLFEELEPRLLLSAGAEAILAYDALNDDQLLSANDPSIQFLNAEQLQNQNNTSGITEQRQEIVFIDSSVSNYEQTIADLESQNNGKFVAFVVIDSEEDGIQQISDTLAQYQDLDAVHFLTHGTAGSSEERRVGKG